MLFTGEDAVVNAPSPVDPAFTIGIGKQHVKTTVYGRWLADDEIDWAPVEKAVSAELRRLAKMGVPVSGVRILLLPAGTFCTPAAPGGIAAGMVSYGYIYLAAANDLQDLLSYLRHEVGHLIADRLLGTDGYDWTRANEKAREYLRLRGYPDGRSMDAWGQLALPWTDRAAEWFAEDFEWWAAPRPEDYFWFGTGPAPPEEVSGLRQFFDGLFGRTGKKGGGSRAEAS